MPVERFPIEEGHVLAFARAIGDGNPAYRGPDAAAPPTFVQASAQWDPNYPLRPRNRYPFTRTQSQVFISPRTAIAHSRGAWIRA